MHAIYVETAEDQDRIIAAETLMEQIEFRRVRNTETLTSAKPLRNSNTHGFSTIPTTRGTQTCRSIRSAWNGSRSRRHQVFS